MRVGLGAEATKQAFWWGLLWRVTPVESGCASLAIHPGMPHPLRETQGSPSPRLTDTGLHRLAGLVGGCRRSASDWAFSIAQ